MDDIELSRVLLVLAKAAGCPSGPKASLYDACAWANRHDFYSEAIACKAKTLNAVSEFFSVPYDAVRRKWVSGGMPIVSKDEYNIHDITVWKRLRERESLNDDVENMLEMDAEVIRRKRQAEMMAKEEDARARKLKNDEREGSLLDAETVERNAAEMTAKIRMRMESIPDEIEMMLPAPLRADLKQEIADKLSLVLGEMSRWTVGHEANV